MKRGYRLTLMLFLLAALAGYLLSKASWVGRTGINLFYQQYKFLKVWWQSGLLVFAVWMLLFFLQGRAQKKLPPRSATLTQIGALLAALIGLYFTYQDFRHNTAHRWLGERFHLGGYLFWIGWMAITVFYLTEKRPAVPASAVSTQHAPEAVNRVG